MKVKKCFGIPIFSYDLSQTMGTSPEGVTKVLYESVQWLLPEMQTYDHLSVTFDGENLKIFNDDRTLVYKASICEIDSFFRELERKYTKDVWMSI